MYVFLYFSCLLKFFLAVKDILLTFTVVRKTGQIFYMSFSWDLSYASFMFKLQLCVSGGKKKGKGPFSSHHIISTYFYITYD